MDSLMSRINPHFLFNGLNSIASLTNTDGKKAEAMALQLAEFYKYASNRENKIYATVQEELALLDQYLKVEKMRFGDMIAFQSEVDENARSLYVPYMLLQPLLENAIKYGYHTTTGKTEISLQIKHTGTHLVIKVYDSGRPFDESLQHGFGIHSINRKLEILYGHDYELQFINGPQKHVFLQLPLKTVL
ncbi:MAG: histidine kinase [Saprospiraceae bacterium]|nr:histidine kinase [Saprospiraceae bacterium]